MFSSRSSRDLQAVSPSVRQITKAEFVSILALIFSIVSSTHWSTTRLPLYLDEATFYGPYTHHFFAHFWSLTPDFRIEIIHPPLYFAIVGVLLKITGWGFFSIRLISFAVASLFLTTFYAYLRLYLNYWISGIAVLALFMTPVFYSEVVFLQPDIPMATFLLASFYFVRVGKLKMGRILFTLAAMVNGIALAIFPAYMAMVFYYNRSSSRWREFSKVMILVIVLLTFWILYFLALGGALPFTENDGLQYNDMDFQLLNGAAVVFHNIFVDRPFQILIQDGRWMISILIFFGLFRRLISGGLRSFLRLEATIFLMLVATEILFLSFFGGGLQRYIIIVLPFLFFLLLSEELKLPQGFIFVLLCFYMGYGYTSWRQAPDVNSFEEYREAHLETVRQLQWASQLLKENFPRHQVGVNRQFARNALSVPYLGYMNPGVPYTDIQFNFCPFSYEFENILKDNQSRKIPWVFIYSSYDVCRGPHANFDEFKERFFKLPCLKEQSNFSYTEVCELKF